MFGSRTDWLVTKSFCMLTKLNLFSETARKSWNGETKKIHILLLSHLEGKHKDKDWSKCPADGPYQT